MGRVLGDFDYEDYEAMIAAFVEAAADETREAMEEEGGAFDDWWNPEEISEEVADWIVGNLLEDAEVHIEGPDEPPVQVLDEERRLAAGELLKAAGHRMRYGADDEIEDVLWNAIRQDVKAAAREVTE